MKNFLTLFGVLFILGILVPIAADAQCPNNTTDVDIRTHTDVTCNGANDGTITVDIKDSALGTPYNFVLYDLIANSIVLFGVTENENVPARSVVYSNVPPGNYAVLLIKSGCGYPSNTLTIIEPPFGFVVEEPDDIAITPSVVSQDCDPDTGVATGSIGVSITGGTSPYTVTLSGPTPGSSGPAASPFTFSNLNGGIYNISVQDAHNCTKVYNNFSLPLASQADADTDGTANNSTCLSTYTFAGSTPGPGETGTWTFQQYTGAGAGNFNFGGTQNSPTATVTNLDVGVYKFRWTISSVDCTTGLNFDEIDITRNPDNTVSAASSTPTLCINTALTAITHTTTSATGIANDGVSGANGLPAGVSATWAANTITISGTPTASGTFNYSILLTGGCGTVNATGTITVNPNNTVTPASSTPTLCINTALTAITHTTTGATGIANDGISGANGLPAGVSATWASNTITISGTPTVSGTFNYSILLTGGCGTVNATGTITVNANNTVGAASSTPTLCINTALTAITHTTTGATGIANAGVSGANGLPAGVSATWASNTITISGTPTASGTFNYSIPLTGGCGTVNATGTITINPNNTVSAASSTPTLCINTALTAITHTTTGATGIANNGVSGANGLPAGVSATWASNTITISGTPTASGTFNYSIPLTGGCGTVNATGTITVNVNTVSAPSSTPALCVNTALTAITHTTTGATGIANDGVSGANGLPAGVSATWVSNTITISGTPTASGTFNYSIPLTGGCGTVNATGTITVTPNNTAGAASSTPTLCINTALTAITHTTTGATGISNNGVSGANGLPAGVSATWASNTITISGTPTASGTFNYSIPLTGGCGTVNATGTITVNPGNTVGAASSTPTLCINTALTAITHTTTGATGISNNGVSGANGLPAGVSATWASNTITISGTPTASGTFNYSIPLTGGCGTVNATGTITVTPNNTVSAASSTPTLCINTALTAITHTTTGATGISNDGISGANGLPAGVSATWASNTITISGTPTASGTFNYSIPLTGGCGTVNATGTITVNANNTVGAASSTPTLCINTALTAITHTTTGATGISNNGVSGANGLPAGVSATWASNTITISGTPTASGTFNYSIPLTGGCGTVNATGTITVNPNSTVSAASSTPTLCINTALTAITHTTTGATGIANDGVSGANGLPAGVSATWASNTITISGTPTASGTFNYSIPLTGGCGTVNATGTITVTPNNTVGAASSTPTLCINTALTAITHTTTGATGISNNGVSGANGLPAGVSATWASNIITISGTPTASGTFNYSIPLTGGCGTVNATGTITVNPGNTVGAASSTPTLCINTALTAITHTTTGATGISNNGVSGANGLPAGVSATWASNTITISGTPTVSGTFNYSIPLTGGCGTVNATGTITINPNNTVGAASSTPTLCINTALTAITHTTTGATGISNDGISGANGLPAGVSATWASNTITISGTPTASGTFNYSIPLTGGCGTVNATGTITVNPNNTVGAASSTPTSCINTALTAITHTTTGATGISNDGVSGANGLPAGVSATWASNTITISGTPTASGTFNYSIPLTGGCGTVNATGTITVNPDNTVGAASSTPTLCINTVLTAITHTTTGATGISNDGVSGANGLPAGVSATWASNTITISGTPTASGTFNYSIPLTGGCGTVNATGTITVNPDNTVGAASSTPTLCINTALTAITHTTTGATGISNDGVSGANGLPAGVSATWASNTITISGTPTASGTFNYSIPLTGGCGTVNATGTITVNVNTVNAASSTPTLCINTALTAITHTTTGATGIANDGVSGANGLPAGVSATWASNTITISGTPTASGTFNYSILLTGGCGTVNATGTITVTIDNTVGAASSTPTLCINTVLTAITHTTTGATGISNDGVSGANGLPAGVSATWASNTITISGTPTVSGTFNYSIPLTGGCGTVNATGTITVNPDNTVSAASSTPSLCITTALTSITHTTTGATGISNDGVSGANGLPAGVSATWASNTITISGTPTASGTFNYSIPLTGGCGTVSATGTITVNTLPTAPVGGDVTVCFDGAAHTGNATPGAGETIVWYTTLAGNTVTTAPNGTAAGTYTAFAAAKNSTTGCESPTRTQVTVTINALPTVTITTGASTICEGNTSTYTTQAGQNNYLWNVTGGAITGGGTTADNTVTVQWTTSGSVQVNYTDANGCTAVTPASRSVTVDPAPTIAAAGTDQSGVCGTVSLSGNTPTAGTGAWSFAPGGNVDGNGNIITPSSPTSGFNGTPGQTYTLRWSISSGTCTTSSDDVTIAFDAAGVTPSSAGPDQTKCNNGAFKLAGNTPSVGTGQWTFVGPANGASINSPTHENSTVTGLNTGASVTLRWSISNGGCTSTDDVTLSNNDSPSAADAGSDQAICGTSVTLAAVSPAIGTGAWTIQSGTGGTVITPSANNSTFNGTAGETYVLRWTVSNGACAPTTDDVSITFDEAPTTALAGADILNACGTITLNANNPAVGTGQWSFASGGNPDNLGVIVDPSNRQSDFNGSSGVTYTLTWTISNGSCASSSDDLTIQFSPGGPTPANAGGDQSVCGATSTNLSANTPAVGVGQWSFAAGGNPDGLGVIADVNNQASGFTGTAGQNYILIWTISAGTCTSQDQVSIQFNNAPTTSNAGSDQNLCVATATLAANAPTVGTGIWSFAAGGNPDGLGAIADVNNRNSSFTGTAGQTYVLTWTISSGSCTPSADDVQIVFNSITLNTFNSSYCQNGGTLDLTTLVSATPAGGTLTFTGTQVTGSDLDPTGLTGVQTINVQYDKNSCSITKQLLINMLAPTNPLCTGGGGGGCSVPVIAKVDACNGNDGQINITSVSGGTSPYTFSIDNGATYTTTPQTTASFTGLPVGTYAVLVKDANGCQSTVNTIVIASKVSGTVAKTDVTTCTGSDGVITFSNLQGGTVGSYTFSVDGGTTFQAGTSTPSGFTISGLAVGSYGAVIKDNVSGCISTPVTMNIALPGGCGSGAGLCSTVVIVPKPSPAQCTLSNGKIVFSIKPFVPAVNNTGVKISIQGVSTSNLTIARTNFNDSTFNALPIGVYNYTIEYGDPSCTKTGQVTVDQSGTVGTPVVSNLVQPTCAGDPTGAVTLDVPGETGNVLEWSLDGGVSDPFKPFTAGSQITGIPAGAAPSFDRVISVRRNSSDPCYASVHIIIQDANPAIDATFSTTAATCDGNDGAITVSASGGSGSGYQYSMDGGVSFQATTSFTDLAGGSYTIRIRDGAGCEKDFTANVVFPGFINSSITQSAADCTNNGESGSITVAINDPGTFKVALSTDQFNAPADDQWKTYSNPSVTFSQLARGQYFVYLVSGATTCPTRSAPININGIFALSFDIQPACTGNELSLSLTDIVGQPNVPFEIWVYKKFTNIAVETIPVTSIPATGSMFLDYNDHTFLRTPDEYQIQLVQINPDVICEVRSPLVDIKVSSPLDVVVGKIQKSYPDIASGSLQLISFTGGLAPYQARIELDSAASLQLPAFDTDFAAVTPNKDSQLEKVYDNIPPGRYLVQVQDSLGCSIEKIARVPLDTDILIPNIFTPNDDGQNDEFYIRNLPVTDTKLMVTSRWGKEVFSSTSYKNNWKADGIPDGVYFYTLQVGTGTPITGWVEVLRGQKP